MSRTFALLIIAAATITAAGIATFAAVRDSVVDGDSSGADDGLFFIDADRPPANGEKSLELANQPISVDIPGIRRPPALLADQVSLDDATPVIGVTVGDQARAYVVDAFAVRGRQANEDLAVHLVEDSLGGRSICVTHCDRRGSTRVLELPSDASEENDGSVRIAGWDGAMLLWIGEQRYRHDDPLPLADVAYERTTWGAWRAEHPDTTVYAGPTESPSRAIAH